MGLGSVFLKLAVLVVVLAIGLRVYVIGTGPGWGEDQVPEGDGKVVVITGANTGLGKGATSILAEKGYTVIMACRSMKRGKDALDEIVSKGVKGKVVLEELDLSEPASIDKFVSKIKSQYNKIDILLNNAGIMAVPFGRNSKGWELQLATNHLGHFLLTGKLLPLIKKAKGRIVNHSSVASFSPGFNITDLQWEQREYDAKGSYCQSKLANLYFTHELHKKMEKEGVTVTAAHPGGTATDLQHRAHGAPGFRDFWTNAHPILMSPRQGTLSQLRAAFDTDADAFYGPAWLGWGPPVKLGTSLNSFFGTFAEEEGKQLWALSEKFTGFSY